MFINSDKIYVYKLFPPKLARVDLNLSHGFNKNLVFIYEANARAILKRFKTKQSDIIISKHAS